MGPYIHQTGQVGQNMRISHGTSIDAVEDHDLAVVGLRKSYAKGDLSSWHHHGRHQLIYAVSGLMLAQTERARWAVPAGHGLVMPAGVAHQIRMLGRVQLQSVYLRPEAPGAEALLECRIVAISPLLAELIASFTALQNPWPETPQSYHLAQLILIELAQAADSALALPFPDHAGLHRVCRALVADPALPFGLDHWAAQAGMSRRAFTRAFQRETGMSFGEWRQRLRCQGALQAIADGVPLAQAAKRLGYACPYALRKMMQRHL